MRSVIGDETDNMFISDLDSTLWDGRGGSDTIDYRQASQPVFVHLNVGTGPFGDTYVSIENIRGAANGDYLEGNGDSNILIGRAGADTLVGWDGDDTLYSDATGVPDPSFEIDLLAGGAGNDVLWAGYSDYVDGGDGIDTLLLSFQGVEARNGPVVEINTSDLLDGTSGDIHNVEKIAYLWGSPFDDRIVVGFQESPMFVFGEAGNDQIVATSGTQVVAYGGIGDDTLLGSDANDILNGDDGSDLVQGGAGSDWLYGGNGDDTVFADLQAFDNWSHQDHLFGGAGNDVIFAGAGDIVDGGDGYDTVHLSYLGYTGGAIVGDTAVLYSGGSLVPGLGSVENVERIGSVVLSSYDDNLVVQTQADPATVYAWHGNDLIVGQQSSVTAYGGTGNDLLVGSTAADTLYGEQDNDRLVGGGGNDDLWGGAGADRFIFANVGDHDRILDFQAGSDSIDLSDIDANVTVSGNQAFHFVGAAEFSHQAGELRVVEQSATSYFVGGDVDGNGTADFMLDVALLGAGQLSSTDLNL